MRIKKLIMFEALPIHPTFDKGNMFCVGVNCYLFLFKIYNVVASKSFFRIFCCGSRVQIG